MSKIEKGEWASIVASMLAAHPDWAEVTVQMMQVGLLEAVERQKDRVSDLSLGLYEALSTRPGTKKRDGSRIAQAVRASNFFGSPWANDTIAKEQQRGNDEA